MGIMWGEVASSALERVGENVSADLERARARRQAIIDTSIQDMFTSGKEAFAKRKLEREGIQDNIKDFPKIPNVTYVNLFLKNDNSFLKILFSILRYCLFFSF